MNIVTVVTVVFLVPALTRTASGQRDIAINVYNDGFSQITEKRSIDLEKGQSRIRIYDIAENIDPGSITVEGNGFEVRWIDYRYDFVSAERLLHRFIGREIQFRKTDSLIAGILIRYDSKYLFMAQAGWPGPVSIYEREDLKNIELPELPDGLESRPTINIGIDGAKVGRGLLTVSYMTTGLSWNTEYRLGYDGKIKAEFSGWVNLDNQCGLSFPPASISLVAGKIEREKATPGSGDRAPEGSEGVTAESTLEPLVDYHRYQLPFKAPLGEKESKQVVLFSPKEIEVDHFYRYEWSETKSDVKSVVAFNNDNKSGLGFPLPPGRMSIYDSESGVFLGSGKFEGAPADEKTEIVIGTAFDIKAERRRVDHRKLGRNKNEDSFEIELRNHKSEEAKVAVWEELYGYWEITEKSDDFEKRDFQRIEFEVTVPAGKTRKITYSVEYSY